MEISRAAAHDVESVRPVKQQWTLTDRGALDEQVHIQVGTLATGY